MAIRKQLTDAMAKATARTISEWIVFNLTVEYDAQLDIHKEGYLRVSICRLSDTKRIFRAIFPAYATADEVEEVMQTLFRRSLKKSQTPRPKDGE